MKQKTKLVLISTIVIVFALIIGYFIKNSFALDENSNTRSGNIDHPGTDIELLVREKRRSENNIIYTSTKRNYIYFDVELKDMQSTDKYYLFADITLKKIADSYSGSNIKAIIEKSTDNTNYTQVNEVTLSLYDVLSLAHKLELSNEYNYFRVSFKINNTIINIDEDNIDFALNIKSSKLNDYAYSGSIAEFVASAAGDYEVQLWGAQGGNASYSSATYTGGKGGYSYGIITLNKNYKLYIGVGETGGTVSSSGTSNGKKGYNGGGAGANYPSNSTAGGGGGATHVSTRTGLLKDLKNYKDSVLIVAAGGGGAKAHANSPSYSGNGGFGGGLTGGNGVSANTTCYTLGLGATQTAVGGNQICANDGRSYGTDNVPTPPSFGQGGNYLNFVSAAGYSYSGGGGGYYGGSAGFHAPAGGGSSYIGGVTKGKTIAGNELMPSYNNASTMIGNSGNGYARITALPQSAETVIRKEDELRADVVFLKTDNRTQKPITGSKFRLWGTSDYGGAVDMEATSHNGVVMFKDVPLGEYSLKEIEAAEGYKLNATTYTVEAGER